MIMEHSYKVRIMVVGFPEHQWVVFCFPPSSKSFMMCPQSTLENHANSKAWGILSQVMIRT